MKTVTAAIINKNGKYLITQRAHNDQLPLKWEFPGGKVEAGETPEFCLKREIKEELNLDITVGELFSVSTAKDNSDVIKLMAYKAFIVSGDVKLQVHNDAKWVLISQLKEYDFCPADIEIIRKLREKEDHFI